MAFYYNNVTTDNGSSKDPVANSAALPLTGNQDGDMRVTLDTHDLYVWNEGGSSWDLISGGGGGGITSLNSQIGSSQSFATGTTGTDVAISSSSNVHTLNIPNASASARGVINTSSQSIGGLKNFLNGISLNGLESEGSSTVVLNDNASGTAIIYAHATYNFAEIIYSLSRDSQRRMGRLIVVTNGTTVTLIDDFNDLLDASGVTFSSVVNGSNININYALSNTGFNANLKYVIKRWI